MVTFKVKVSYVCFYIFAIFRTFDVKQYATLLSSGLLVDPLDCFFSEVNRNS